MITGRRPSKWPAPPHDVNVPGKNYGNMGEKQYKNNISAIAVDGSNANQAQQNGKHGVSRVHGKSPSAAADIDVESKSSNESVDSDDDDNDENDTTVDGKKQRKKRLTTGRATYTRNQTFEVS